MLTNRTLPHSTGFGSIFTNLGRLQNRGIELEMNARILPVSSSIQWSLGFNASKVTNKILKLPDNGVEIIGLVVSTFGMLNWVNILGKVVYRKEDELEICLPIR